LLKGLIISPFPNCVIPLNFYLFIRGKTNLLNIPYQGEKGREWAQILLIHLQIKEFLKGKKEE